MWRELLEALGLRVPDTVPVVPPRVVPPPPERPPASAR